MVPTDQLSDMLSPYVREVRVVVEAARRLGAAGRPVGLSELLLELPDPALQSLLAASAEAPTSILLAQGGGRCQPLLGIYPAENQRRQSLAAAIEAGERRLQSWLAHQDCVLAPLPEAVIRNVNSPSEL